MNTKKADEFLICFTVCNKKTQQTFLFKTKNKNIFSIKFFLGFCSIRIVIPYTTLGGEGIMRLCVTL